MTFAKIKIEGIGKFKCKNIKEFEETLEVVKIKLRGEK